MDMRMVHQIAGPGVEDPDHAALPTAMTGIESEGLQGGRGGRKKQVVHDVLVGAGDRPQVFGQREGDEKGGDRQQESPRLFQPGGGGFMLTRGAMPVFAGMIAVRKGFTRGALVEMAAQGLGTALLNGFQGREVAGEQAGFDLRPVLRAMTPDDCRSFDHEGPPEMLRGLP
jgi:hypothetical protein